LFHVGASAIHLPIACHKRAKFGFYCFLGHSNLPNMMSFHNVLEDACHPLADQPLVDYDASANRPRADLKQL
jgi:hypothetical protein